MTEDPTLPKALQMMGECMAHIAELDDEMDRNRFTIWFQRGMALLCFSGAIASTLGTLDAIHDGRALAAGLCAGAVALNLWVFGSILWRVESVVHGFRDIRRKWAREADRLAGIIGPLVLAQAQAEGNDEKEKYTTICTIIRPTDGVN